LWKQHHGRFDLSHGFIQSSQRYWGKPGAFALRRTRDARFARVFAGNGGDDRQRRDPRAGRPYGPDDAPQRRARANIGPPGFCSTATASSTYQLVTYGFLWGARRARPKPGISLRNRPRERPFRRDPNLPNTISNGTALRDKMKIVAPDQTSLDTFLYGGDQAKRG
jgi:hypothetical protein